MQTAENEMEEGKGNVIDLVLPILVSDRMLCYRNDLYRWILSVEPGL